MHRNWSLDRCESLYYSNSDKRCKYFHSLSHCTWIMPAIAKGLNDWSLSHPSSNFLLYFFWPLGVAVAFHRCVKMEKVPYLSSHRYRVLINGYPVHLSCCSHMTMTGRRGVIPIHQTLFELDSNDSLGYIVIFFHVPVDDKAQIYPKYWV